MPRVVFNPMTNSGEQIKFLRYAFPNRTHARSRAGTGKNSNFTDNAYRQSFGTPLPLYSAPTPMPSGIGMIPSGTTFSNMSYVNVLNFMLYGSGAIV